jgi:predicted short-subunit dehydrogenase-like oxidoreductase (DUF2520 family)
MKISLVGTGNVATHLAQQCHLQHIEIVQIIGRNASETRALAAVTNATFSLDFENIDTEKPDIFLLAVSDSALEDVAQKLSQSVHKQLVVHVSGTVSSDVLKKHFSNFGVFYPLQTFSKGQKINFQDITFFVDASSEQGLISLKNLAQALDAKAHELHDSDRMVLHVAAVFANNFTNYLFQIAQDLLEEKKIPFSVLLPLIQQTVEKLEKMSPQQAQTGPARRGDLAVLEKHSAYLEQKISPQFADVYRTLSQMIVEKYTEKR